MPRTVLGIVREQRLPRKQLARDALEAIEVLWTEEGSIVVCVKLDLPYALKLMDLMERGDPTLTSELRVRSCVLGEQHKGDAREDSAPAEVSEAEYAAFEPALAAIIFAPDHFAALGLDAASELSDKEVRRAVNKTSLKAHPDKNLKERDSYDARLEEEAVAMMKTNR